MRDPENLSQGELHYRVSVEKRIRTLEHQIEEMKRAIHSITDSVHLILGALHVKTEGEK